MQEKFDAEDAGLITGHKHEDHMVVRLMNGVLVVATLDSATQEHVQQHM